MDDIGEDVLIDVQEISLSDLKDKVAGSGLEQVLDRMLSPEQVSGHYGFNNYI